MKTETIKEFLARGGEITKVSPVEIQIKHESVKFTPKSGILSIMSLEAADRFYGERKPKKVSTAKPKAAKQKSKKDTININAIPEAIRDKYIARLREQYEQDDYE